MKTDAGTKKKLRVKGTKVGTQNKVNTRACNCEVGASQANL